ncbi:hypothetical protein MNBD_BACTEROID06-559 [hydrothermal vent metagenome]|uniref:EamA domain-containing protein n=1 Tax=hydrothermal vent metagenome TaxID=652676 RepID=A0A3B0U7Z1_9ZZZZ
MLKSKPYLHLHFLVFLWGFTAILGLLIKLSFPEVVFYRTLIAFIAFIPVLLVAKVSFKMESKVVFKLLVTGVIISFHWLLFFGAARYANASVSLIGLATTSLWTALLEPLARKKRISKLEVLFGIIIIFGIYIIYLDDFSYGIGLVMSIASAFLGTIPFVLWHLQSNNTTLAMPLYLDWGYLLVLALVCTVYANAAWVYILKKISAFAGNLVINLEPIYGILLALLIFGKTEEMNPGFYWGGLVIIAAIFAYPIVSKRFRGGLK